MTLVKSIGTQSNLVIIVDEQDSMKSAEHIQFEMWKQWGYKWQWLKNQIETFSTNTSTYLSVIQ